MMTAEEARKRSSDNRWTAIGNAIIEATNAGETNVTIKGYVSDGDYKALNDLGYYVELTNRVNDKYRETYVSWDNR